MKSNNESLSRYIIKRVKKNELKDLVWRYFRFSSRYFMLFLFEKLYIRVLF